MSSLAPRLRRGGGTEFVILTAVLVLIVFYYFTRADTIGVFSASRGWSPMTGEPVAALLHFITAALFLAVIPVVVARRMTGLSLVNLGLGFGNWRAGLVLLAVGVPLAVLAGKIGSASPAMRAVYPLVPVMSGNFVVHALIQFLYFGAWEVLFRGVLLFGLRARLGDGMSNTVQTSLSVTAHFGRAFNETFAAFPAGLVFGWIGLKLNSIWYIAVIHWVVGMSVDWFLLH